MAHVHFTSHLRALIPHQPLAAEGASVREALDDIFHRLPQLRSYVLDDQGRLRKHVCIFVDGVRLTGATALDHTVSPSTELYVMQALSGGRHDAIESSARVRRHA